MRVKITSHGSIKKLDNYAWSRDQQIRRHMRPELPSSIGHSLVWLGMHSQHASLAEQVAAHTLMRWPGAKKWLAWLQPVRTAFFSPLLRALHHGSVRPNGRTSATKHYRFWRQSVHYRTSYVSAKSELPHLLLACKAMFSSKFFFKIFHHIESLDAYIGSY